jgi:uncharacterized membrane protein
MIFLKISLNLFKYNIGRIKKMNILSIFAVILFYFFIKYLFRIISIGIIIKMIQKLKVIKGKNNKKRGDK